MPIAQNYDNGVDIRNQRDDVKKETEQQNPVLDALKTLQLYVSSQKEQGNEAPAAAFIGFLDSLRGGGGEGKAEQPGMEKRGMAFNPFEAPEEKQADSSRQEMPMQSGRRGEMQGRAKVLGM